MSLWLMKPIFGTFSLSLATPLRHPRNAISHQEVLN